MFPQSLAPYAASIALTCVVFGCAHSPKLAINTREIPRPEWTEEEKTKPKAVRVVRETETATHVFIRITANETSHIHPHNDITLVTLDGKWSLVTNDGAVKQGPGDMLTIARGTVHAAVLGAGEKSGEVYAVITPPMGEGWSVPAGRD